MKRIYQRSLEIVCLTLLAAINLTGICWGPPAPPPSVPAGNAGISALTIFAMAAYGYYKSRK